MGLPRTPTCHCNLRQQLLASILCLLCFPTSLPRVSSFRPHSIAVTDVKEDAQADDYGPPATIASSILGHQRSNHAYVTLLYGEDYVLGVRVLGESIRMTGTTKDLVVLVSTGVTETSIIILRSEGWVVHKVNLISNPNKKRPKAFWGVYTKLRIFNMTNYDKVLYLDADVIVASNVDDAFECASFCAVLRHSERFNTGVMLVSPDTALFNDMMTQMHVLPSYTGGDQGFLNAYFNLFAESPLFHPGAPLEERAVGPTGTLRMQRLPTAYNADVGLYALANRWIVDPASLRVVHFTLGPLKPWEWWSQWVFVPVAQWQAIRRHLPSPSPNPSSRIYPSLPSYHLLLLFFLPLLLLALLLRHPLYRILTHLYGQRSLPKCQLARNPRRKAGTGGALNDLHGYRIKAAVRLPPSHPNLPPSLGVLSIAVCFFLLVASVVLAVALVPNRSDPWTGPLLTYEWASSVFAFFYIEYLKTVRTWGHSAAGLANEGNGKASVGRGHPPPPPTWDLDTLLYLSLLSLTTMAVPAFPFLIGATGIFKRFGLMVGGGVMSVAYITWMAAHLGAHWFRLGTEEYVLSRVAEERHH